MSDDFMEREEEYLEHYGTPRHSGRYPWGSGKKYQRSRNFISQYEELYKKGLSKAEIAKGLGLKNTSELNSLRALAREEAKISDMMFIKRLHDKGMSNTAIAQRKGKTEGWVRQMLRAAESEDKKKKAINTVADGLAEQVREKKYIDFGKATNLYLGISENRLKDAVYALKQQGYGVIYPRIMQPGTGKFTKYKVIVDQGIKTSDAYKEVTNDPSKIKLFEEIKFPDNGHSGIKRMHDPVQVSTDRVLIRYAEEGGKARDGTIELKRTSPDLDMGEARYAQVRIAVENKKVSKKGDPEDPGKYFLKGMAVYGEDKDFPPGKDIIFNTGKHIGTEMKDVFKKQEKDPHNPFKASIDEQNDWVDENGKSHKGALNIVRKEGKWDDWSKNLASQFLSKQTAALAKRQLDLAAEKKENEYDDLMSLTNPTLKKQLLKEFADECDSAAVCLKAAAMPRQSTKVLLPLTTISDKEVFAPTYDDGEEVVLIRYPHGGLFEIPRLIVNNNNREGIRKITKSSKDAIGISPKTAEQLSGADFDGDTVIVIPTKGQTIKTEKARQDLINYDAKELYANPKGVDPPWKKGSQAEHTAMGMISNLITDMTLQDAPADEVVRAVKHSQTIIDAGKHNLNVKASYEQNGIRELEEKWRGGASGAATLISRAKGEVHVRKRDENRYDIDPETGEKIYIEKPEFYVKRNKYISGKDSARYDELNAARKEAKTDKERKALLKEMYKIPGVKERAEANKKLSELMNKYYDTKDKKERDKVIDEITSIYGVEERTMKSTKMAEAKDAAELSSGLVMEEVYKGYANRMKKLGNKARLSYLNTGDMKYNETAAKTYAKEVASLKQKLIDYNKNKPLERQAQAIAMAQLQLKRDSSPEGLTKEEEKKIRNQAMAEARDRVGAKKNDIEFTDREWEAIQTGAVKKTMQRDLFMAADSDKVKQRALPRQESKMTDAMITRAKRMIRNNITLAEVAETLGVSVSTLQKSINS